MTVTNGHIKLSPRQKKGTPPLPVDAFFCTLAEKHKGAAIGIILSGNGQDGSNEVAAIYY